MGGQFLANGLPGLDCTVDGLMALVISGLDMLRFVRDVAVSSLKLLRAASS